MRDHDGFPRYPVWDRCPNCYGRKKRIWKLCPDCDKKLWNKTRCPSCYGWVDHDDMTMGACESCWEKADRDGLDSPMGVG